MQNASIRTFVSKRFIIFCSTHIHISIGIFVPKVWTWIYYFLFRSSQLRSVDPLSSVLGPVVQPVTTTQPPSRSTIRHYDDERINVTIVKPVGLLFTEISTIYIILHIRNACSVLLWVKDRYHRTAVQQCGLPLRYSRLEQIRAHTKRLQPILLAEIINLYSCRCLYLLNVFNTR